MCIFGVVVSFVVVAGVFCWFVGSFFARSHPCEFSLVQVFGCGDASSGADLWGLLLVCRYIVVVFFAVVTGVCCRLAGSISFWSHSFVLLLLL